MRNRPRKYTLLKGVTILLSPIFLPLGIYIALKLNEGLWIGFIALAIGMVLYLLDAWIFWFLIEKNRG